MVTEHNLYFIVRRQPVYFYLNDGPFPQSSVLSTLPDNSLMSITEDNQGWLWVGCNDGLLRIKEEGEGMTPSPSMTECQDRLSPNG